MAIATITRREFNIKVQQDAKKVHYQFQREGQFWPLEICMEEVQKKLATLYKIKN